MGSDIIGEAAVRIRPETSSFGRETESAVSRGVRSAARRTAGVLGAGILARTIAQQIGAAGALQTSLRSSVSLLGLTERAADRTFSMFSAQVAGLSREVGIAQTAISDGLYEALGAGVPKNNAIEFLRVAAKGAVAGGTTIATTVDGLTTILNAYGLATTEAQRVSDSLFQTVNAGKARFDEIAASIFQVGPIAASANVSIETVGAALATLTAGGVPAAEATTQLRSAIQSIIAPSVRAEKLLAPVFKRAGFESGQAALKTLGFQKTIGLIAAASDGSSTKLTRMLGRVEALNAVITLTGKGSRLFTRELRNQANAAGVTDKALAQIERSAGRSFDRAGNAARNFGLFIGDAAAPGIARLADNFTAGLDRLSSDPAIRQSVGALSESIADSLTDPRTIASARELGGTVVDVLGAVRTAAEATAPAIREIASALGAVASSPAGPTLLLTAAAYGTVGRVLGGVATRVGAFRTVQQSAAKATALSAAQSVSAIGLIGPSSARAASATVASTGRIAGALSGIGRGALSVAGGPLGLATLGVSALAAGAFVLSGRESDAARHAREFSSALRDQAAAADVATAALDRQRDALSGIIDSKVAVDQAKAGVTTAKAEVARVAAAPASDFGGEKQKTDALTVAKNALAAVENRLNLVRRGGAVAGAQALRQAQAEQTAQARNLTAAQRTVDATGNLSRAQVRAALVTNLGRTNALNFAAALSQQARAQTTAASKLQLSANVARQSAAATDVSTASGKKHAAQLRAEAGENLRAAAAARTSGIATARRSLSIDRSIVSSKSATAAERAAAADRVKIASGLIGQLRAQGRKAGQASGEGIAGGAKSKAGEIRAAGKTGGEAAAAGAGSAAPQANAAGEALGVQFGVGVVSGIDSQTGAVQAAGARLAASADDGGRGPKGVDAGSPSRKGIKTGQDYGRGLQEGIKAEQARTSATAAAVVARAVLVAGRAGARNARTQGGFVAREIAEGFRVKAPTITATIKTSISSALRESIATARSNFAGFASQLAELGARAIDAAAPSFSGRDSALDSRGQALDAASAIDEERRLRNAVRLAEAGSDQARKRFESAQASIARRTPEQDARLSPLSRERERQRIEELRLAAEDPARAARIELDRFLLGADQTQLDRDRTAAEAATQIRRDALAQQLADLSSNLAEGRIKIDGFNRSVTEILASNGVNIAAVGARLGTAFVDQFNLAARQLRVQGGALAGAPRLPGADRFTPGIERPNQVAITEAITTRNVLRTGLTTELARVRTNQAAQRAALEATFTKATSAGGTKIVGAEVQSRKDLAAQHKETLKELRGLGRAFTENPPQNVVNMIINSPAGATPEAIADALARRLTQRTARTARR